MESFPLYRDISKKYVIRIYTGKLSIKTSKILMKTEFLYMDLSITDSHFLNSENYIHTSVYMEHFYEVAPMDWG